MPVSISGPNVDILRELQASKPSSKKKTISERLLEAFKKQKEEQKSMIVNNIIINVYDHPLEKKNEK